MPDLIPADVARESLARIREALRGYNGGSPAVREAGALWCSAVRRFAMGESQGLVAQAELAVLVADRTVKDRPQAQARLDKKPDTLAGW